MAASASGWGNAFSSVADSMRMREQIRLQEEARKQEQANKDRQFNLMRDEFLANQQRQQGQDALSLRNQMGPGEVPEAVGAKLSPYGLAEGTLSSTQLSPGADPNGMPSYSSSKGKFSIPANFLERAEMAKQERETTRFGNEQTTFQNTQDDRAMKNEAMGGLTPPQRTQALTGVDTQTPPWAERQAIEQKNHLQAIGASKRTGQEHQWDLELANAQHVPRVDPNVQASMMIWRAMKPGEFAPPEAIKEWLDKGSKMFGPEIMGMAADGGIDDIPDMSGLPSTSSSPNNSGGIGSFLSGLFRRNRTPEQYNGVP